MATPETDMGPTEERHAQLPNSEAVAEKENTTNKKKGRYPSRNDSHNGQTLWPLPGKNGTTLKKGAVPFGE